MNVSGGVTGARAAALRLVAVVLCACTGAALRPSVAWAEDRPTSGAAVGSSAERQARGEAAAKAFVLGQFEEALAIYLDLYVQSGGRPEYLRNIGRCQQKLKRYDRAIDAFKDYLKRAKRLGADEKREIEGYIAEMEAAASSSAAPALPPAPASAGAPASSPPAAVAPVVVAPAPAPPPAAVAPVAAPPAAPVPAAPAPAAGDATAPSPFGGLAPVPAPAPAAPTPADAGGSSRMRVAGVVVLVAAAALAIGGTAALLSARSTFKEGEQAGCQTTGGPICEGKATDVETASAVSKALYVGAGLAGTAGVLLLVLAPPASAESNTRVGLGLTAQWAF